jgi:hypothetical protein
MHLFFHKMIRNLEFLFLKRLNDEAPVDQIFQRRFSRLFQPLFQFLAGVLGTQQLFPGRRQLTDLRVCDHVSVHNCSDPIDHFGLGAERSTAKRQ